MMEAPVVHANNKTSVATDGHRHHGHGAKRDEMAVKEAGADERDEVVELLGRIFQMCDVERRGQISIDDLLLLGQQYLGQDTNKVSGCVFCRFVSCYKAIIRRPIRDVFTLNVKNL